MADGIKLAGVPRESLFLTTKINNMNHKHVAETMEESLHKLQADYVDLVLMHWPVSIGMEGRDFYDGDKLFQEKEEKKHQ